MVFTTIPLNFAGIKKNTTMIITVANPIYDSVFKYLMEDNRVAKTVLSALLKKEVVEVEMRKHGKYSAIKDQNAGRCSN